MTLGGTHSDALGGETGIRHVVMRDLVVIGSIGIMPQEHVTPQRIRVSFDLSVPETEQPIDEQIGNVVDYNIIIEAIKADIATGHVELIETLVERIATLCLRDARVAAAMVLVEKLDVYPDVGSVGISIRRERQPPAG